MTEYVGPMVILRELADSRTKARQSHAGLRCRPFSPTRIEMGHKDMTTGFLSKEQFLARSGKLRTREFDFADGKVMGRKPTTKELRQWRKTYRKRDGSVDPAKILYADELLLAFVLTTPDGLPLFTTDEILSGLFDAIDGAALGRLCKDVAAFAGIGDDDEDLKLKDAIKNSEDTPTSDSSSD